MVRTDQIAIWSKRAGNPIASSNVEGWLVWGRVVLVPTGVGTVEKRMCPSLSRENVLNFQLKNAWVYSQNQLQQTKKYN